MKNFKTLILSAIVPLSAALSPAAFAGTQPSQIVELFTSQGCSSCPPSNALVNDWSADDDILALTYSVEYWDYLGWKDTFADPKFSARQRAYAQAIGHGRVYTPQMVINGQPANPDVESPAAVRLVTYTPGAQSVKVMRGENGGRTLTLSNVVAAAVRD